MQYTNLDLKILAKHIKAIRDAKGYKLKQVAQEAGINYHTFRRLIDSIKSNQFVFEENTIDLLILLQDYITKNKCYLTRH
jgi:transcriptional regulator with XRE-family HTH domain